MRSWAYWRWVFSVN